MSKRKDLARDRLQGTGIPKPAHWLINLRESYSDQAARIDYPAVVKPLALSASRGVIRVDNAAQFTQACAG